MSGVGEAGDSLKQQGRRDRIRVPGRGVFGLVVVGWGG